MIDGGWWMVGGPQSSAFTVQYSTLPTKWYRPRTVSYLSTLRRRLEARHSTSPCGPALLQPLRDLDWEGERGSLADRDGAREYFGTLPLYRPMAPSLSI